MDLTTKLGPIELTTPLIAASGSIGSVVEWAPLADTTAYGALVAKSVSAEPWPGRPPPRVAATGAGMLNGIGIQNSGVGEWRRTVAVELTDLLPKVWGSAVGNTVEEYVVVARELAASGVRAIEINLSCPNLEDGAMFALNPGASQRVVSAVRTAVSLPVGAKLSPNSEDIGAVAEACWRAGADWLVLTNTVWGAGFDIERRSPLLSGVIGGLSGPPLKPIALRCVVEVRRRLPSVPIVGTGGVLTGADVVEYLLAGADAVGLGTIHFAEPNAGRRILNEFTRWCQRRKVEPGELRGLGLQ